MSIFDWSTTPGSNGNSDSSINFQENQAPNTLNDSARALMARLKHWSNMLGGNTTQGGSSNAYTLTSGESLSAYAAGMRFLWSPNADSTGAVTLNVDSIGAKKVYMPDGSQAGSGDLDSDSLYDVVYQTALDSSNGGFKIAGFQDTTLSSGDYLAKASNLSDLADASTARTNLGVEIGSDVQAHSANLTTYAATPLTTAELTELQKIGSTTISATQWSYLGGLGGTPWTSANGGTGSGLDADLLDGSEGSEYAKLADNETVSGDYTFTGTPTIQGGSATLKFYETDGPSDEKRWHFIAASGNFLCQTRSDDEASAENFISFTRTGVSVDNINLNAAVNATSITAPPAAGTTTSGSLSAAANANKVTQLTGNPTIAGNVFAKDDFLILYAGASARTITQGGSMTMRLDGTSTTGSRTLAARGVAVVYMISATECVVCGGAVS